LSLNRPKALHALNPQMCAAMHAALTEWADGDSVQAVILDHAEGRGFCAGGDIAFLRDSALNDGGAAGRKFFFDEYRLNHQLFTYAKPTVAFMDGITMGAGSASPCPAGSGLPPGTLGSPCRRQASACSPMWAAAGICRACRAAWGSSWR
jgi:enoyl-CoA hydratase